MVNFGSSETDPENLDLSELRQKLREARLDRDGWHVQAKLSNSHLQRIIRSPAWRITKPFRVLNLIAWKINPNSHDVEDDYWTVNSSGKTVWQTIGDEIRVEVENANLDKSKIAIVAHWSRNEIITKSTNRLVDELLANDYEVVLISASEVSQPLQFDGNQLKKITVLRKPNYGYDFGSWSVAFAKYPKLFQTTELLVINDSNSGPFGSMSGLLNQMSESPFDITGVTDSLQIRYHIQSYMMHFKNGALGNESMQKFWLEIRSQEEKMSVIQAYELGLTSRAQSAGLYVGAVFPWNLVTDYWENPSISGATRLVELGLPFIKREVIRNINKSELKILKLEVAKRFGLDIVEVEGYFLAS